MEAPQFKFVKGVRSAFRSKVTKFCNKVTGEISGYAERECKYALEDLENLKLKLESMNTDVSSGIFLHETDQAVFNKEMEDCEHYSDKIVATRRILNEHLGSISNSMSNSGRRASYCWH